MSSQTIKRTGELLLSGWKMLNMACPICKTPLMSKGELMRCPHCDLPVVTELPEAEKAFLNSNQNQVEKVSNKVEEDVVEEDSHVSEFCEPIGRSKTKKLDNVSSKLGQKMLMGW